MVFDRMIGETRVLNAGSVGMPYGSREASWLLLGEVAKWQRTEYDYKDAARRVRATDYPQADGFVDSHLIQPTPEETMLELFGRGEVGRKPLEEP